MRVRIFQSGAGDCLLVSDVGNKKHMLVDGGLKTPFREHALPTLAELYEAEEKIDVVYVSHDDQDHIAGVLGYVEDLIDWKVYRYQHDNGNELAKEPARKQPPDVEQLWHNAFRDLLPEDFRAVKSYVNKISSGLSFVNDLEVLGTFSEFDKFKASEKESLELSRLAGVAGLRLKINRPAGGGLMQVDDQGNVIELGDLKIRVIGPHPEDLEKLRAHWKTWLAANESALDDIREAHADAEEYLQAGDVSRWMLDLQQLAQRLGDRKQVTLPNLASLMLLVEDGAASLLLTGDGHHADVLKGLGAVGKTLPIHVDVLKIPHHGSEYNTDERFYEQVTADHYVFCGNGAHENPDLRVIKALLEARINGGAGPAKPFEIIFNAEPDDTSNTKKRRAHMKEVLDLVKEWHGEHEGAFSFTFQKSAFFDIDLNGGGG